MEGLAIEDKLVAAGAVGLRILVVMELGLLGLPSEPDKLGNTPCLPLVRFFEADLDIINSLTSSTMADGLALVMSL